MKAIFPSLVVIVGVSIFASCGKIPDPDRLASEFLPLVDNPLVAFRILVKIGTAEDPTGKDGLCRLAWSLLAKGGSRLRSHQEITTAFDSMAAGVSLSLDKEMSVFSATVPKDHLKTFYTVFKDMLLDPGFRPDDFARLKADQLDFVEKTLINDRDESFGEEILNMMIYEGHPYGRSEAGTVESIQGLTLEDVKAFYRDHFVQGNIVVGLAGGYPSDFPAAVLDEFEKLPIGFTPRQALPQARTPRGLEFILAEKTTTATTISMGFPVAMTKADKDFFALWIAGTHLGDRAHIEHYVQGRDKYPDPNHSRQQQYFSSRIGPIPNGNRHFVIRQTIRELKRVGEEGLSEEQFQFARTALLNDLKLYAQTVDERLGWQMDSQAHGFDDFLAIAQEALPKLTRDEVNKAARKYLQATNVYIAVVTSNATSLKDDLLSNAPSPNNDVDQNLPAAVMNEDLAIRTLPLEVKPENVRIIPAGDFFRKAGIPGK